MAKYNRFLYDHIGREYERKNRYLNDVAALQEKLSDAKGDEKSKLRTELETLKKGKADHPYIKELRRFEDAEKAFLKSRKEKVKAYGDGLEKDLSRTIRGYKTKLYKSELSRDFYKDYMELTHDAAYSHAEAEVGLRYLPGIIEQTQRIEKELQEALEMKSTVSQEEKNAIQVEIAAYKVEQKRTYDAGVARLKAKRREGQISKKALKNGISEYEKEYKNNIRVSNFKLPEKAQKELIKSKRFELRDANKVNRRIVNADIAEERRNHPVEVEKQVPFYSYLTFLLPGLGQLLNKQFIKAGLFLIGLVFIYGAAVPYALGYGNYQGDGIAGLISLAEGGTRIDKSLIFMIEGIIAIFLMLFALALLIVSFKDVNAVEKQEIRGSRVKNWFETKTAIEEDGFPYLVSMPALVVITFIVMVPITTALLLSFTGMNPQNQSKFPWVGIQNYRLIALGQGLAGSVFWLIFWWTILWTILATTLAVFIGFGLALLANNERIKGKGFFRVVYLLPWAVPAFITILFFSIMFSTTGPITEIFNGIFGTRMDFKNNTYATRTVLILLQGWLGSSYVFLLSTGVLQAIPEDLYEAAQIDGATTWQKIRKITLPLVLFQTAPLLVNQYTFNFNNFSIIYLFNGGGPFNPSRYGNLAGSTDILISYIYKLTMDNQYQAVGAAITIFISLGLMFFAWLGFRNSKAFKEERL